MQTLDKFGDHAVCCTTGGDLIVRHNRIRDLVDQIAREGHLGTTLEKKGILGETSGRRPGDVTISSWCEGKSLAVDVAVTCPFSSSNLVRDVPAEYVAQFLKHKKYDDDFKKTNYVFSACIFESTGAINREGTEFLSQLFRFAARYSGVPYCVYAGRAWARISCTLQGAVAQSIINRAPSVEESQPDDIFEDEPEPEPEPISITPDSLPAISPVQHIQAAAFPGPGPAQPEGPVVAPLVVVNPNQSNKFFFPTGVRPFSIPFCWSPLLFKFLSSLLSNPGSFSFQNVVSIPVEAAVFEPLVSRTHRVADFWSSRLIDKNVISKCPKKFSHSLHLLWLLL